jgi:hypothetical protein
MACPGRTGLAGRRLAVPPRADREAKHHPPLVTPWLSTEPVYYHWPVYADMAVTSGITGIEPLLLLLRLSARHAGHVRVAIGSSHAG